jgi:hypothetical protein
LYYFLKPKISSTRSKTSFFISFFRHVLFWTQNFLYFLARCWTKLHKKVYTYIDHQTLQVYIFHSKDPLFCFCLFFLSPCREIYTFTHRIFCLKCCDTTIKCLKNIINMKYTHSPNLKDIHTHTHRNGQSLLSTRVPFVV